MDTLIRMIQRRDTAANWSSANPVLEAGEFGYDTTNKVVKIGDGSTRWNALQAITAQNVTVGNGTITIKQGGVTKGTFTVNQSGNTTIELEKGSTTAISWKDVTDKPDIGTGLIRLKSTDETIFGEFSANATKDQDIILPINESGEISFKAGKGIVIKDGEISIDEDWLRDFLKNNQ